MSKSIKNNDNKKFSTFLRCATRADLESIQWFDWSVIELFNNNKTPLLAWLKVVRQDSAIIDGLALMGVKTELKPTNTGFKDYEKSDIVADYNVVKVDKKAGVFTFEAMLQTLTSHNEAERKAMDAKKELDKKAKQAKKQRAQGEALQALHDASSIDNETVRKAVLDNAKKEFKKPKIKDLINDLSALEIWAYDLEYSEQRAVLIMLYSAAQAVLKASGQEAGEFALTSNLEGEKIAITH